MAYYSRGKNKFTGALTIKHSYINYIKDIDSNSKYFVDLKTYTKICKAANKIIRDDILYKADEIKLPYRLGSLRIRKIKTPLNKLSMDFKLYNETGIRAMHLNEHTKGYHARWYWHKKVCNILNHTYYSFLPSRENKRILASYIKSTSPQIKFFE